tara:strand:+ start:382 stop:486 length:105 start_codon:yes stop_codon:yes gene_type:complete
MVTYLLKKSYQHKTYKEINFKDLWGGVRDGNLKL